MSKKTYEAYAALKKAMNDQERFGVDTEYRGVDMDEKTTIDRKIYELLKPFYARRRVAVYEAAKSFVAAYEEEAQNGETDTDTGLARVAKLFNEAKVF